MSESVFSLRPSNYTLTILRWHLGQRARLTRTVALLSYRDGATLNFRWYCFELE